MLGATTVVGFRRYGRRYLCAASWDGKQGAAFEMTVQSKLQSTQRHSPPDLSVLEGEIAGPVAVHVLPASTCPWACHAAGAQSLAFAIT